MELHMNAGSGCKDGGHLVICQYNRHNMTFPHMEEGALNWIPASYNITNSLGTNGSSYHPTGSDMEVQTFGLWEVLSTYYTPVLTSIGVSSNVVMAAVLISAHLERNSANHYLAAAMLSDAIYLVGVLLLWLQKVGTDLYNRKGWCQFIYFISRVSSFLSLWLMVAFSVDRLIVHVSPRRSAALCTPFRAKLVILALVVVAVVVFVNISLTVGVVTHYGVPNCVPLMRFVRQLRHLDLVDSLVNVIVPYALMLGVLAALSRYVVVLRRELDDPHCHGVVETNPHEAASFQARPYRLTSFSTLLLLLFIVLRVPCDALRLIHSMRNALNNFSPTPWHAMALMAYLSPVFDVTFAMKPYLVMAAHHDFRQCAARWARKLRLGCLCRCCCCPGRVRRDKLEKLRQMPISLEEDERKNNNAEPEQV